MCYVPAASDCVAKENHFLTMVGKTIKVFYHQFSSSVVVELLFV